MSHLPVTGRQIERFDEAGDLFRSEAGRDPGFEDGHPALAAAYLGMMFW
jgi:hypothetical protein